MANRVTLLDHRGQPITPRNGKPRREVVEAFARSLDRARKSQINARYDAAQDTDEFRNYWAAADSFDADSANSREVRHKLIHRSRYEIGNNGYADGIASTWTTDLVGNGPTLRMQTASEGFNKMVELAWWNWCQAVQFRRKLWCLAHALHSDGEGLAVTRRNPRVNHPVKLDLRLYEAEQCQTPLLPFLESGYIDGIKFDEFGEPIWYDILKEHPGATGRVNLDLTPERVPARFVLHWFKMKRPGQHRGVPACSSTLNAGAAARRWREAILAAAETAADFSVLLKSLYEPADDEVDATFPFDTQSITKRMMVTLPNSVEPYQMKAEHPNSTFEAFHRALINEQARPVSMPYNKAACDSSDYNYASGRLDHQTYYASLDTDRDDCNDTVLDPLFAVWFEHAVLTYGWLGGNPDAISPGARYHLWDWPKHRVADVKTEADANDTKLKNGTASLASLYTEAGEDYEDEVVTQAESNGITPEQQKQINLLINLPQHALPVVAQLLGLSPTAQPSPTKEPDDGEED
jgi:capsid protein